MIMHSTCTHYRKYEDSTYIYLHTHFVFCTGHCTGHSQSCFVCDLPAERLLSSVSYELSWKKQQQNPKPESIVQWIFCWVYFWSRKLGPHLAFLGPQHGRTVADPGTIWPFRCLGVQYLSLFYPFAHSRTTADELYILVRVFELHVSLFGQTCKSVCIHVACYLWKSLILLLVWWESHTQKIWHTFNLSTPVFI